MITSYLRLTVAVFNTDKTPNEIRKVLLNTLPDDELEVCIDEHTGSCSDGFCGEHD